MHVHFSEAEVFYPCIGLVSTHRVHSMMDWRDYYSVDIVISFICAFVNKGNGRTDAGNLIEWYNLNFKLVEKDGIRWSGGWKVDKWRV